MFLLDNVTCGNLEIDQVIPDTIHLVISIIKIIVPIIIIIFGMIDMMKAVTANEEKEMKEAQKKLIKRIIYGVLVFFVISIVQFIFRNIDKSEDGKTSAASCISCFVNGSDYCGSGS